MDDACVTELRVDIVVIKLVLYRPLHLRAFSRKPQRALVQRWASMDWEEWLRPVHILLITVTEPF